MGILAQHRRFGVALATCLIDFVPEHPASIIAFADYLEWVVSIGDIEQGKVWEQLPFRYRQFTGPNMRWMPRNGGYRIDRKEKV